MENIFDSKKPIASKCSYQPPNIESLSLTAKKMMINRALEWTPSTEVFFFNLRQINLPRNQLKFKKNEELFRFRTNFPASTKKDLHL